MRVFIIGGFFLMFQAGTVPSLMCEEFPILMSRRAHTGDRYTVECKATQATRLVWTIDGKRMPASNEVEVWRYGGAVEILEASAFGTENRARVTVTTLTSTKRIDGKESETVDLLPSGAVIIGAWKDGRTVYTVEGQAPAPNVEMVLSRLMFMEPPTMSLDQAIFGSARPQAVGASWPVDAKFAAEDLTTRAKTPAKAENITGSSALVEATPEGLKITSELIATDIQVPLHQWMTVTNGRMRFEAWGIFPTDHQRRPPRRVVTSIISATGTGDQDGKSYVLELTYRITGDYTMTPTP